MVVESPSKHAQPKPKHPEIGSSAPTQQSLKFQVKVFGIQQGPKALDPPSHEVHGPDVVVLVGPDVVVLVGAAVVVVVVVPHVNVTTTSPQHLGGGQHLQHSWPREKGGALHGHSRVVAIDQRVLQHIHSHHLTKLLTHGDNQ